MRLGLRAAAATGIAVLALAALAPACGSTDEVVARIRCTSNDECDTGSFCSKQTCDSRTGSCEILPPSCGNDLGLVCGCPSTTEGGPSRPGPVFWNDCVRRMHGAPSALIGGEGGLCPFTSAASCLTSSDCTFGSFCSHLRSPDCRPPADPSAKTGYCLALPPECPTTIDLGGGTIHVAAAITCDAARTCTDWCTAVRSETPFFFVANATNSTTCL